MLKTPTAFGDQVLWPEFQQLDEALRRYLSEVTTRIIHDEVHKDISEAAEAAHVLGARVAETILATASPQNS